MPVLSLSSVTLTHWLRNKHQPPGAELRSVRSVASLHEEGHNFHTMVCGVTWVPWLPPTRLSHLLCHFQIRSPLQHLDTPGQHEPEAHALQPERVQRAPLRRGRPQYRGQPGLARVLRALHQSVAAQDAPGGGALLPRQRGHRRPRAGDRRVHRQRVLALRVRVRPDRRLVAGAAGPEHAPRLALRGHAGRQGVRDGGQPAGAARGARGRADGGVLQPGHRPVELRGAAAGGREHGGRLGAARPRLPAGGLERGREEVQEVHPVLQPGAQRVDRGRRVARGHRGRVLLHPLDAQQRDPGIPSQLGVLGASQYLNPGRCGDAGRANRRSWVTFRLAKRKIYNIYYSDCISHYIEAYVLVVLNSWYGGRNLPLCLLFYLFSFFFKAEYRALANKEKKAFISAATGWQTEFVVGTLPPGHVPFMDSGYTHI